MNLELSGLNNQVADCCAQTSLQMGPETGEHFGADINIIMSVDSLNMPVCIAHPEGVPL